MTQNKQAKPDSSANWLGSPWLRELVLDYAGMLVVLAILIGLFSSLSDSFLTRETMLNVLNEIPDLTLVAVGMTLVLIIGGIDLSVGAVMALSGSLLALLLETYELPLSIAMLGAITVGCLCGAFNGCVSIKAGLPSFIVTLGMLELARGGALLVSDYQSVYLGTSLEWFRRPLGVLPVSPSVLVALASVVVGQGLLSKTVFGRRLIAIGTNEQAVRLSGINPQPYQIAVFTLCGTLAGLGALAHCAKMSSAYPEMGVGLELSAIAAVVIGGTSLMGGRGSVINTLFGVLVIAILQSGLDHISLPLPWKRIVTGAVIIIAVLFDLVRHRAATSQWWARRQTNSAKQG